MGADTKQGSSLSGERRGGEGQVLSIILSLLSPLSPVTHSISLGFGPFLSLITGGRARGGERERVKTSSLSKKNKYTRGCATNVSGCSESASDSPYRTERMEHRLNGNRGGRKERENLRAEFFVELFYVFLVCD